MRGSRLLLEMLKEYDVKVVFGLPGETTLDWYRDWADFLEVRHIVTRDERSASYMAEAYARVTGRPGVFEMPSPGAAHGAPGVAEAFRGSVPVVFFTSDVPLNHDLRNTLSTLDQNSVYRGICKETLTITTAEDIPFLVRRAFRVATTGKPGPVHLKVPSPVYNEECSPEDLFAQKDFSCYPPHRFTADSAAMEKAVNLLAGAEKPVMVCGQGVLSSRAWDEVICLAEALQIPVGTTSTGKGAFPEEHPLSIRVVGARGGLEFSNTIVQEADVVFYVGSNTDSSGTDNWKLPAPGSGKRFVQLDVSGLEIGNNYPLDVVLIGDAAATLSAMAALAGSRGNKPGSSRQEDIRKLKEQELERIFGMENTCRQGLFPVDIIRALNIHAPEDALFVIDPGVSSIYSTSLYTQKKPGRKFLSNYSVGALGYAIPASVGAAVAAPDRPVIALSGDGSFGFNCGELETMCRLSCNITFLLLKNDTFGWIRGETLLAKGFAPFATEFSSIDYLKIAEGFGLKPFAVEDPCSLEDTVKRALAEPGPSFVLLEVTSQDKLVPPVPKWVEGARSRNLPYIY